MPRILLLAEYPTLFGGEMSMLSTLDAVRAAGFEVRVAAPPIGSLADELTRRSVAVVLIEMCDASGQRLPQVQCRERLERLLAREAPDLLHANSLSMGRLSGPVAASLALPSIAHLRDIIRLSAAAIDDLNRHTRLIAVSQATRDSHVAAGLSAEKTVVVYNGVDLELFQPRPANQYLHRELGLPRDAQLVGTIGQISLRKGVDALVEAAARVVGQTENVHFLIVGARYSEKDESRRLEDDLRATAARLDGRVHLLGVRTDVDRLLPELTLLVHSARQEPLGRVLLEAAAAGTAIIATDVGGTREIFPPGSGTASLVPPDDVPALASEIQRLAGNEAERQRLKAAARDRAVTAFDVARAGPTLVEQYRDVLAQAKQLNA